MLMSSSFIPKIIFRSDTKDSSWSQWNRRKAARQAPPARSQEDPPESTVQVKHTRLNKYSTISSSCWGEIASHLTMHEAIRLAEVCRDMRTAIGNSRPLSNLVLRDKEFSALLDISRRPQNQNSGSAVTMDSVLSQYVGRFCSRRRLQHVVVHVEEFVSHMSAVDFRFILDVCLFKSGTISTSVPTNMPCHLRTLSLSVDTRSYEEELCRMFHPSVPNTRLRVLRLNRPSVKVVLRAWASCPNLVDVTVRGTPLTDADILQSIREGVALSRLKALSLLCCGKINGESFGELVQRCPRLQYLDLSDCKRLRAIGLRKLAPACRRTLETLVLSGCKHLQELDQNVLDSLSASESVSAPPQVPTALRRLVLGDWNPTLGAAHLRHVAVSFPTR